MINYAVKFTRSQIVSVTLEVRGTIFPGKKSVNFRHDFVGSGFDTRHAPFEGATF